MPVNREKFRNIVGGITTPKADEAPAAAAEPEPAPTPKGEKPQPPAGQGREPARSSEAADEGTGSESRRFAKRGRPKGRKEETTGKARKVKVSLFMLEYLVNDLYDWAYQDKKHPGEMFEQAVKQFHEKESKRRNAGKE